MVRVARIGAGVVLVVVGLFLLVLPGPGMLAIAGGLAILAVDFAWARNLLEWMKRRFRDYFTGEKEQSVPDDVRDASN